MAGKKPFKTLTKYSYSESGTKYIKVLLSDLSDLKSHPEDKLKITYDERSFSVMVEDYQGKAGNNLQFTVPKL
jgi:hypothetical protein